MPILKVFKTILNLDQNYKQIGPVLTKLGKFEVCSLLF